jgi:hypothetical protein
MQIETITIDGVLLAKQQAWILHPSNNVAKNVVLLVPVRDSEEVWSAWEKMIKALDPRPEKVIFCENNSTDRTLELIWNWDYPHEVIRIWTREDATKDNKYEVIAQVRDLLLTRARQLNPEYAIFLDYDVFPVRRDMIARLVSHKKDAVGGCYRRSVYPNYMWICGAFLIDPLLKKQIPKKLKVDLKKRKKNGEFAVQLSDCSPELHPAVGAGMGCFCISRNIIQNRDIFFYPTIGTKSEDYSFCDRILNAGYEIYLDGAVKLLHAYPTAGKTRPWLVRVQEDGKCQEPL